MCLTISVEKTKEFFEKCEDTIKVYKYLTFDFKSPYYLYQYKVGENVAFNKGEFAYMFVNEADTREIAINEIPIIDDCFNRYIIKQGIHVHLDTYYCHYHVNRSSEIVVEFTAKKKDLIACSDRESEAVFTTIYLSEEEYKKHGKSSNLD